MNVIQFYIEVHEKNVPNINNSIIEDFKKASSNPTSYSSEIKREWNIQKPNLNSLYSDVDLIAFQIRENIKYFIFNISQIGVSSKDRITLDILILSNIENIDYSINKVIDDIKEKLKNKKIKVLRANDIFLFPHNSSTEDIYDQYHKIKAIFYQKSPNKWEWLRMIVVFLSSFFLILFAKYGNPTSEQTSIFVSLYTAGIAFLVTELLIKVVPSISYINKKLSVSIKDLSDCIRPHHPVPFADNTETPALVSPQENE